MTEPVTHEVKRDTDYHDIYWPYWRCSCGAKLAITELFNHGYEAGFDQGLSINDDPESHMTP